MGIWRSNCSGKRIVLNNVPGRGEVERHGVILQATGEVDTPDDREARIAALEAKHGRGERLFEPGVLPPIQPNRYVVL